MTTWDHSSCCSGQAVQKVGTRITAEFVSFTAGFGQGFCRKLISHGQNNARANALKFKTVILLKELLRNCSNYICKK